MPVYLIIPQPTLYRRSALRGSTKARERERRRIEKEKRKPVGVGRRSEIIISHPDSNMAGKQAKPCPVFALVFRVLFVVKVRHSVHGDPIC